MIDILFLNLHRRYANYEPTYGGFLGIYLLAAFIRNEGFEAKSFSGTLERGLSIVDRLCAARSCSMIGLYCDFENVTENIFLSAYVKEKYRLPVIVGGPQATALGGDFFARSKCNAVVRYEGELTVLELMNFFLEGIGSLDDISGIAYPLDGNIKINRERPLIRNLDALPLIDEDCYIDPEQFRKSLSLMTGRGCPFRCAFCHEGSHTRAVRFRSVENVLAEVDAYLAKQRTDEEIYIFFTDDTLTLNPERLRQLCMGMSERRKHFDIKWFCEGHVHSLYRQPEMVGYLAAGGCHRIQLGIESGTAEVLRAYGKQSTPEEIIEVVRACRDVGIEQIYSNIILGGAHFTRETFENDKRFALRLLEEGQGTVELGIVTYWPLPETPMTKRPSDFGIKIVDAEFVTSVGDFPQIETAQLDRLSIVAMQNEFEQAIDGKMTEMLEGGRVPTERIMRWLREDQSRYTRGAWVRKLRRLPVLQSYYELLSLGEGISSKDIDDLAAAHPLRVIHLYRNIRSIDARTVEVCGERLSDAEVDMLLLTTGKLSISEIAARLDCSLDAVIDVMLRLERRHFIIFALH